ncbi:MAG: protein kinase, partial [Gemmatimonas sp.]
MSTDLHGEARILFDELFELDADGRAARLRALGADSTLAYEVASLLNAASRSGDFLKLLPSEAGGGLGETLIAGRYRIVRPLGSGAMGDVYLASDLQLERSVALKFLRPAAAVADPTTVARFRAEARAAARLDHPHAATVYDSGETDDGRLFIVMAYYAGETLRERIARAPLAPRDALKIAAQVASALAAAHAAGIVHRDVKPANVLFDAEGAARLADFGIAKLLVDADVVTRDAAVGTPAYMSPEQTRGDAVDAGIDLWALGVMLHEMLTGHRPRGGATAETRNKTLESFDTGVCALLDALLHDDRAKRPTSATAVRDALDALAAANAAAVRPRLPEVGRGALPNPLTRLIGRDRELVVAHALLTDSRLLTLTGPGGTGKTRLSIELASRVRGAYPDGVWFVPLAEIAKSALVPWSVAQVLGVSHSGSVPPIDRVIAALSTRRALLVLDNMEHVLEAAPFVAKLLAECPTLSVLATSRAPLAIQGEQTFSVLPLATPIAGATDIGASDAVQLFVNRARAVKPSLVLDDESLEAVAEICRRLDGLPLALELAAARATLLSPRAILARLATSTELLRADSVDRPARH